MKTRTIYKSTGYWTQAEWDEALDYYRDEWKEQSEDPCDDAVLLDLIHEADSLLFGDERMNLNKVLDGKILVIADLGRWNGRFQGYKVIGRNLQDILSATGDDEAHFYSDGKNIRADGYDHDGHSYYLFREIKDGVDISALLDDIYNGKEISNRRMVVFYKMMDIKDQDTGEEKNFPYLRYYTVFEVGQCEGIERKTAPVATEEQELPPIERAEAIVAKYPEPPRIRHEGDEAYYSPVLDIVTMPPKKAFESAEEYYSTLFHELAHSTGHKARLGRDMATTVGMRSDSYAKEELVAEIASAMLCGMSGIENSTIENSVAYIQSWRRRLEQDPKLIVIASSQAQKASDYILGEIPAKNS